MRLRRLGKSDARRRETELDAAGLRESGLSERPIPIASCGPRARICATGRIRSVTSVPRENEPKLEAELSDGTGALTLVWLGRRRIAGIEPGRRVTVRGRVVQSQGRNVLYNAEYELLPPED